MVRKQATLVLLAVTLFGALGGLIATLIQPVHYQAKAYVIVYGMPRGFTDLITPDEATDLAEIYRAGALQNAVVKQVTTQLPGYSAGDVARDVRVQLVAYTPQTRITATGDTAEGAATLANAVANAWIAVAGAATEQAYAVTKATLEARKADLTHSIAVVRESLIQTNPKAAPTSTALHSLRDALGATEAALQGLPQQLNDAMGNAKLAAPATASDAVRTPDPLKNLVVSVAVGLAIGLALDLWLVSYTWRRQLSQRQPPVTLRAPAPRAIHRAASGQ